jgi:Rap1a immunity proteins
MKYGSYVDLMLGRKSTTRKLLIAAVAVVTLVGNAEAATEATAAMNGHRLMQGCSSATSKKAPWKTIYCYGYVRGIADGFISTGACLPPQVNTQQLVEVALRYLRDHPEKRHLGSGGVLIPAWGEAWPCAEEKPTFKPTFKPVSEEQTRVYAPNG